MRQFWQLQQSKTATTQHYENDKLIKEIDTLKEQLASHETVSTKVTSLEEAMELLTKSESELKSENTRLTAELTKLKTKADQVNPLKIECEELREQLKDL